MALSTAAGLSARFPVISSAGWFQHQVGNQTFRVRLIDGGYVDNSGLATTRDIIAALERQDGQNMSVMDQVKEGGAEARLISLAIVGPPARNDLTTESFQGLNEILSPVLGFLNVYGNRSDQVIEQARFDFNRDAIQSSSPSQTLEDYGFRGMYLDPTDLPLGWLLSKASQKLIRQQVPTLGDPLCQNRSEAEIVEAIAKPHPSATERLKNNACVVQSIALELQGNPSQS